jgi:hypothetical protein
MEPKVITVTEPPAIGKPMMVQGINDETKARNWARRMGFETVYWFAKHERVYADRTQQKPVAKL